MDGGPVVVGSGEGDPVELLREPHVALFASHEAALIPALENLSAADTQMAMTEWRLKAEALDDFKPPKQAAAEAHLSQTLDGRWYLNGAFDAEPGRDHRHRDASGRVRLTGT